MRNRTQMIAAAVAWGSLSLGGLVFAEPSPERTDTDASATSAGADAASQRPQQDGPSADADLASAGTPRGSNEASDQNLTEVRKVLARATEAAVSEDGISRLAALLSKSDQQRVSGRSADKQGGADEQRTAEDPSADKGASDDATALTERVRQFRQDWKEKYGREFGVQNQEVVFSGVRLDTAGRAGATATAAGDASYDRAQTAGSRAEREGADDEGVVNAPARDAATFEKRVERANQDKARAGGNESTTSNDSERSKPGDAEEPRTGQVQVAGEEKGGTIPSENKLPTEGRTAARTEKRDAAAERRGAEAQGEASKKDAENAADGESRAASDRDSAGHGSAHKSIAVVIPPPRGAQDVHVRLVNESGGWRIDLPDSMNRQQLVSSLSRHLEALQRQKDNWPESPDDGSRLVSQHILLALTETGGPRGDAGAPEAAR